MDDKAFFTLQEPESIEISPLAPDELFRGPFWSVFRDGETFDLGYLSGELAGRFKRIKISEAEARALMAGKTSCDSVLLAHGAH